MIKKRVLTGITTTGTPHLGNYVGAIKPALQASKEKDLESFFFLADYHALIKANSSDVVHKSTKEIAACWLALGLDTTKSLFYRQSDIPEIPELAWLLTCITSKGLMNRAHAYKGAVQNNIDAKESADHGISMGLFSYPILMAADILIFNAKIIPVGRDQIQHVEMARDIAQRFNHHYGKVFEMPIAKIDVNTETLRGLDGRKMSKSYQNTIPLFSSEKNLKRNINRIETNLIEPGEPKDPDSSTIFHMWRAFASEKQIQDMHDQFLDGIAWGEAKRYLFELINSSLMEPRERYKELISNPSQIESVLIDGAERARSKARPFIKELREAVGIRPLN